MDQTPALGRLLDAMNAFQQAAWCEGVATATLSIGGVKAADPDALVTSLTGKSEAAPFGHQGKTKKNKKVRSTLRVKTREKTAVTGLDLAAIVERVEEGLGATSKVEATLLDVLVYPVGGKFLRHKDTPRAGNQLGTLIVEVPVAHKGGALTLNDGRAKAKVDWGVVKDASKLRWVAMYGDVDHEINEVTSGTRVTLVYTLALTGTPRSDATLAAHLDTIADAAIAIVGDKATFEKGGDLVIPCEHLIVAAADATAPYPLDVLRGSDRAIADTLARCGLKPEISELLLPSDAETDTFPNPTSAWPTLLSTQIPEQVFADAGGMLSFEDNAGGDGEEGEEDLEIPSIEKYVSDKRNIDWQNNTWLVRKGARAKHVYEGLYTATGYFGNEADVGHLYQVGAMIVRVPAFEKRTGTAPTKKVVKKAAAKKSVVKKSPSKKSTPKKSTPKKSAAKKSTAKKSAKRR